jgi:protein TonB
MARQGLRSHLSGSVPISIALHLVALILLLIIPLTANVLLPVPSSDLPAYVRAIALPPPPAVTMRPATRADVAPAPSPAAPVIAPQTITPEIPQPGAGVPDLTDGRLDGLSFPIGVPIDGRPLPPPVPEPARPPAIVRAAELPVAPRKLVDARPVYPEIARAARVEGTVVLEAVLDPSGRVTDLRVVTSVPLLDRAALDAVRQWRYTPSVSYGRPVSVLMTITIRFTLQ